jgi:hypothetical protein
LEYVAGLFLHREQANDYDMAFSDTSQSGYMFPRSATPPGLTLGIDDYLAVIPGEYDNYSPAGSNCFGAIQSSSGPFKKVVVVSNVYKVVL